MRQLICLYTGLQISSCPYSVNWKCVHACRILINWNGNWGFWEVIRGDFFGRWDIVSERASERDDMLDQRMNVLSCRCGITRREILNAHLRATRTRYRISRLTKLESCLHPAPQTWLSSCGISKALNASEPCMVRRHGSLSIFLHLVFHSIGTDLLNRESGTICRTVLRFVFQLALLWCKCTWGLSAGLRWFWWCSTSNLRLLKLDHLDHLLRLATVESWQALKYGLYFPTLPH